MRKANDTAVLTLIVMLSSCTLTHSPSATTSVPTPATTVAAVPADGTFPTSVEGLPEAKPMETKELSDGAKYIVTARPVKQRIGGQWIRRLAYNGTVPGPIIKVKQGATIFLTLKNETEIPTTLHPHGLRLDYHNDGVVGISQKAAIAPGGSYDYTLKFPDAGMYWYHPHVREDYSQALGMYGNFWVVPKDPNFYNSVNREVALILDDASGKDAAPFYRDRVTHTLMGRYGDVMLINGQDHFVLQAQADEVLRFFLTNSASTRTIKFALPGARMKLVGSDGGLYEHEQWTDAVTISPSERYIVEARYAKPGTYDIVNNKPDGSVKLGTVEVSNGPAPKLIADFNKLRNPGLSITDLKVVKQKLKGPIDKQLTITLVIDHSKLSMPHKESGHDMHHMHQVQDAAKPQGPKPRAIEWTDEMAAMNSKSDNTNLVWKLIDAKTKAENMHIKWQFKRGDFVKIRVYNDPKSVHPMQHPIHFHGQRFVIASLNGQANSNLVWKDSALIAPGETMDIVLEAANPGQWMAHCHIAEHLHAGMMLSFNVSE